MTHLNSELSLERLDTVSGGGGIFGSFFPAILTKEPKSYNPAPTNGQPRFDRGNQICSV